MLNFWAKEITEKNNMKTYIFYTFEGNAESPNHEPVNNIQMLGRGYGKTKVEALEALLIENPWIIEAGFKKETIIAEQVLDKELRNNIKTVIEYLWKDEQKHYKEDKAENHIYRVLREIKKAVL